MIRLVGILVLALASLPARSVDLPDVGPCTQGERGFFQMREVVELPGVSVSEIQDATREWFARSFRDGQEVLQMDSPGKIIGRGISRVENMQYRMTIEVEVREGRARITVDQLQIVPLLAPDERIPLESWMLNRKNRVRPMTSKWVKAVRDVCHDARLTQRALIDALTTVPSDDDEW